MHFCYFQIKNNCNEIASHLFPTFLFKQAVEDDAVVAIWLYEESLTHMYGYSVLGFTKTTLYKCGLDMFGGESFLDKLSHLRERIVRFCANVTLPSPF
eukprot:m.173874 g.173874  ORF g.173874 m.173874 type:complete len:98 (-) comp13502_c1_seq48:2371-2664(-)